MIASKTGKGNLYHLQKRKQVWYRLLWKRHGYPEKRASQQIKRIAGIDAASQIRGHIPEKMSITNRFMYLEIKRNLLHIVVAKVNK